MATTRVSVLELKNATRQKEFGTLGKMHVGTKTGLFKDSGEARKDLGKKLWECDALQVIVGKI